MNKNMLKKGIILLITTILLCACSKDVNTDNKVNNNVISEESTEKVVWGTRYLTFDREYTSMEIGEGVLYGAYVENGQAVIEVLDKESGSVIKTIPLQGMSCVMLLQVNEGGSLQVLGYRGDRGEVKTYAQISAEGMVLAEQDLVLEDTEGLSKIAGNCIPKAIYTDTEGYTYLWYEMSILKSYLEEGGEENVYAGVARVYVKDEQFNTVFYQQIRLKDGLKVMDFRLDESGSPFFVMGDMEGAWRQVLDIEKQQLGEKTDLNWEDDLYIYISTYLMEDGFCFKDSGSHKVWKFDYNAQKCLCLTDFLEFGIEPSDVLCLQGQRDSIELIHTNESTQKQEYVVLTKGETNKQTLTIGTMWVSEDISRTISLFNSQNDEFQVQIVSYWNEENYEQGLQQLALDVISGKAPDIIVATDVPLSSFATKGIFVDLYSFMEKDVECNKDMLVESILELYEIDGCLYNISPAFYLYSMWGDSDVVQGLYGVGLKEYQRMLDASGKDMSAISGFFADESTLSTLCTFGMDELVDWENGTCNFEGEYFADLINFAKEYDETMLNVVDSETIITKVRRGDVLLSGGMIKSVAEYQLQKELYGGNIDMIGYPTAKGSGTAANFWGTQFAINAASQHQQEAWEFVKCFILNGYIGEGFPLVKEQLEVNLQQAMEPEYVLIEDGVTMEKVSKDSLSIRDESVLVYEASQEDVDTIMWMIENAFQRMERYPEIQDIIDEEAQAYFQGQKSLEQTATIIQNRVTLYLEEQLQ